MFKDLSQHVEPSCRSTGNRQRYFCRLTVALLVLSFLLLWSGHFGPDGFVAKLYAQNITVTALEPREYEPIDNLDDVASAVVQIEAFGRFVDPIEDPVAKSSGRGAGFIIDPAGIAVTNNHVVAGAAFLQVKIAGEAEPRNARVLGTSECADLAVIDISGEDHPYLQWAESVPESGETVFAAGFPADETGGFAAHALNEGLTSVVETSIDTNLVSIDGVLQHNAQGGIGYAGGPLVNANAQVVGISYATAEGSTHSFALEQSNAQSLLAQLQAGEHVDSIGINGQIVFFLDGSFGVWVAGVRPGSPASALGLQGGDIIVSLLDFALTGDMSMATYCDILRSNDSQQPLPVQVIRFATNELLEGQINGTPLTVLSSFADDLASSAVEMPEQPSFAQSASDSITTTEANLEQTFATQSSFTVDAAASPPETDLSQTGTNETGTNETDTNQTGASQVGASQITDSEMNSAQEQALYSDFSPFTDDSGTITLELPDEWDDISNGEWVEGGETIGVYISASTDLNSHFDAWYSDWDTPGVFFGYSRELSKSETPDGWLDSIDLSADCSYDGRSQLPAEGYFTGYFDVWGSCGNTDSIVLVVAAAPPEQDYLVVIETLSVTRADLLVVDHVLDTFALNLPSDDIEGSLGSVVKRLVDTSDMIYEYEFLANDAGNALLPSTWTDAATESWIVGDEEIGPAFSVAPDVSAFQEGWDVPGVWVRTTTDLDDELDVEAMLDSLQFSESCTYDARYDHQHTMFGVEYISRYDLWTDCGEADSILAVVATQSAAPEQFALIEFQAVTDADAEAFGVYLNSFFIGDGPVDLSDESETSLAESVTNAEATETTSVSEDDANFVDVTDETGTLTLRVPISWTDVSSNEWIVDGESYGLSLSASTDLAAYDDGWETPGAFMGVSRELAALEPDDFLEFFDFDEECTYGERFIYETEGYTGFYDVWENCADSPSVYAVLAVKPAGETEPLVMVNVLSTDRSETELFEEILGNFGFDGTNLDLPEASTSLANRSDESGDDVADVGDGTGDNEATPEDTDDESQADAEDSVALEVVDVDVTSEEEIATEGSSEEESAVEETATEETATEESSEEESVADPVISRVIVRALNVRRGPDLNEPRVDSVFVGTLLTTIGQVENCNWLQVVTPQGIVGWVSGSAEFLTMNGECAQLPVADPAQFQNLQDAPDEADAESEPTSAPIPEATPTPAPTPTPTPSAEPLSESSLEVGCFLFQNELNTEVTVTVTRQSVEWNDTFLMQPNEEREECFEPDEYTYTLDAPPPWGSTNGELEVNSGDRFYFPIRSE